MPAATMATSKTIWMILLVFDITFNNLDAEAPQLSSLVIRSLYDRGHSPDSVPL